MRSAVHPPSPRAVHALSPRAVHPPSPRTLLRDSSSNQILAETVVGATSTLLSPRPLKV
jgi:hypothetical protein